MLKAKNLIVESGSIIALDIHKSLQRVGYSVPAVTNSGLKAINLAKEIAPDLVLMELELKGEINGAMAAKQITTWLNIPVIYLTSRKFDDLSETWRYISKPFQQEKLYTAIKIALAKNTTFPQSITQAAFAAA